MDVCELNGPWNRHMTSPYTCDDLGLEKTKNDVTPLPDKTHAIQQLHALLPTRPDVAFLRTDHPFLLRFLRAKKFRVGDAFLLLCRYFEYRQRHRELFRGLNVGSGGGECGGGGSETGIQTALLDGLPGVLAERDPCGRPIIVLLASNWDHSRYDVRTVYQAVLLTLERLVEDEAVQAAGVVAILDWSNFPARLTTSLSPKLLRLMLDGLQDAFPLRLGALHLVNQPWYVEAALSLARPFLKEKLRSRIHVHGNNLATLHAQVPPRLLPAELGGEGGEYHAHTWAATMLNYIPSQNLQSNNTMTSSTSTKPTQVQTPTEKSSTSSPKTSNVTSSLNESSSSTANTTTSASQSTPLVNKTDNVPTTSASFASLIFGNIGSESTTTNGNASEGEDVALKAH
ncbi:clavesin-2-like [Homarus americanus]|uniref:Clavesin-2-like n=1 Tax=Homarus americanus TaxID=6706 RepID=A0A8J5T9A7_HOMAM|nr:clavesin-2-like [Homarus americanus]XP_042213775.1 clavesin-2-like [Homarus americanus]XP_042213776.1 clavesin-2-like [Homarus americanus]KAG7173400.1 Clavesin-2-like [Homarus americanus]